MRDRLESCEASIAVWGHWHDFIMGGVQKMAAGVARLARLLR